MTHRSTPNCQYGVRAATHSEGEPFVPHAAGDIFKEGKITPLHVHAIIG